MFDLRTKNLIVNVASGNVDVDETNGVTNLKGFDSIKTADISDVKMARAQAPAVQINSVSITAPGKAGEAIFYIKAKNSRSQAQYYWDKIEFGKRFPISVSVLAADSEADLKTKLAAVINAQNAKYGDLPFTANASTAEMTGKTGSESISWEADGAVITLNDGTVEPVTWSTSVSQTNFVGFGLGKQLEENVTMMLPSNGVVHAQKADEKPIIGANYAEFTFKVAFDSESVAAPSFVGEQSQSGKYDVCIYVNESQLSNGEVDDLIDELYTKCSEGNMLDASGSDVYGVDLATDKAAFLA